MYLLTYLLMSSCQRQNATVTVVHSATTNPAEIVREADIVVAALGKAEFVRGDWLKPGAVVIDVGINAVDVRTLHRKTIIFLCPFTYSIQSCVCF